jgi:putative GTP pyrophosphokinase
MTTDEVLNEYIDRHIRLLTPLAEALTLHLQASLQDIERIDRITARAKSPRRFFEKAMKANTDGGAKYDHPFEQIQDLVGGRIIVFYKQDVEVVSSAILRYYKPIEQRVLIPERESEFGYFGKHFILALPEELFEDEADRARLPVFFELQVKTLFQHAWSEAGHDLAYKPDVELTSLQKRMVALTAAQAWGADQQFAQLHTDLNGAPRHDGH